MEARTIAIVGGVNFIETDDLISAEPVDDSLLTLSHVIKCAEIAALKTCNPYLLFEDWVQSNFIANKWILTK